jgi:hypothetical protein
MMSRGQHPGQVRDASCAPTLRMMEWMKELFKFDFNILKQKTENDMNSQMLSLRNNIQ